MTSRPFEPRDDESIVALYTRLHANDPSIEATTLDRWRAFRALATLEGGRRFRVVEEEGAIVALMTVGTLKRPGGDARRIRIFVDPPARRRGLARELFDRGEAEAIADGARTIESFLDSRWIAGRTFAMSRGFSVYIHDLFLARDGSAFVAPAAAGVALRAFSPGEEGAVAAISNASLVRDKGFTTESAESIAAYLRFPGAEIIVAEAEGPVGFCHVEHNGASGYIQALGVLPAFEGRGIGAALLSRAIESLRASGAEHIELCTEEDNARARRLYARAGFSLAREAFTLRKEIRV
ncbi:MAG TPA: GNAT family N-acetyltransferase [Polyangiaceae bacterium]|jgi:ribosomal protein S18 acetylase RimI-like enzyme